MKRPYILITNDDGVFAPGINALIEPMLEIGDVIVVAPDKHQSGSSNAITPHDPIRLNLLKKEERLTIYSCSGTPTDCVKMSINQILDRKPDLLLSGINYGPNTAISVIYSGTMGATLEGCVNGIPSIGLSLCSYDKDVNFSEAAQFTKKLALQVLQNGLPQGTCLNVNIPKGDFKGVKFCHQTSGRWVEEFDRRTDPKGHDYFWLSGYYKNYEPENENCDEWAVNNGYVAIVPCRIDLTDYDFLKNYKNLNYEF